MIQLEKVTKTYGKGSQKFTALDNISLEIPKGASVAIVGKSGSGKSTLMHVMSGLDSATSGSITIDDTNIASIKGAKLDSFRANQIGFIFQSFFVQANETCLHNVALPLEIARIDARKRKQMILEALKKVDLEEKVYQKAKNLSGGQKQRLAIARAIVTKPSILFADEPTGNLDSQTGAMIEKLLFSLNKEAGRTLVIVTHDADLAAKCDIQFNIKDGVLQPATKKRGVNS